MNAPWLSIIPAYREQAAIAALLAQVAGLPAPGANTWGVQRALRPFGGVQGAAPLAGDS